MKKYLSALFIAGILSFLLISPLAVQASDSEYIYDTYWSMESIECLVNHDVNCLNLLLYKIASPTILHAYLYSENTTTYVPEGVPLASGSYDASTLTEDISGEWVSIVLSTTVSLVDDLYYDLVLTQESDQGAVVWVTSTVSGDGLYGYSDDSGGTWTLDMNGVGPYRDGLYSLWDCVPTVTNFIATPISCSEMQLKWTNSSDNIAIVVRGKIGSYPTGITDGVGVYSALSVAGAKVISHSGLVGGTTYYYHIYANGALGDIDFATTYACPEGMENPLMPPEWYQAPSCDIYEQLGIKAILNGALCTNPLIGMPLETACVLFTLICISLISIGSYAVTKNVQGNTVTLNNPSIVPIAVGVVLIFVCAIAGALPLWFIAVDLPLGGLLVYVMRRA